jgi:hypothetical protein
MIAITTRSSMSVKALCLDALRLFIRSSAVREFGVARFKTINYD